MKPLSIHFKNILLADDDSDDCMIFEEALKEINAHTQLTIESDGNLLMERLKSKTQPMPDILFLDLNMPRKNGSECLCEIRSLTQLKNIPVIILSTSSQRQAVNKMYEQGANYYICKPSEFGQLKDAIQKMLSFTVDALTKKPTRENFLLSYT
jgi:CheY-like chemotaxis protein